jgi:hypothetical protein
MNAADDIRQAKQQSERARRQLAATAAELQDRLKPGTIAGNAWAGVKDRSGELADGAVEAVKSRPVAVSAALAAFTLFLARRPIRAGMSSLFGGSDEDSDLVTADLTHPDDDYDLTAPSAAGKIRQGARA